MLGNITKRSSTKRVKNLSPIPATPPTMELNPQTSEHNPESPEDQNPLALIHPSSSSSPFATLSLSLSLPSILPSHFFHHPKLTTLFSSPSKASIPSQASSLSHLSLSSTIPSTPSNLSFNSSISSNPLHSPLTLNPRRPSDPTNPAGLRRASLVWFRNDLRLHDHHPLSSANSDSLSVLPVFCFDPRDFGKSSSGFDRTGPHRAQFLIESVACLKESLKSRGSDLVVRIGNPNVVLLELAKAVGAEAVYAHMEASHDEVKSEVRMESVMKEENVEVKYFWGSTLYHVDDLPFKVEDMPTNYGGFREKVKGLEVRKSIEALEQMKGLPSRGGVEPGEVPTLMDLGISPSASMSQDNRPSMVGGEIEALEKLKKFAAECQAQPSKGSKQGGQESIYGANFSCKISPWLAMGCLSPRSMFDEIKKTTSRSVSASSNSDDGGSGTNWLMFELMWRDFFRFVTKKYSAGKRQLDAAPATACMGAFA